MNTAATHDTKRVLIVGRSPNVLLEAVDMLRSRGYEANATNQFDDVLSDYDVRQIDILVFGGMVPTDTKERLRGQVSALNPAVTFVQGLSGIAGLIAAQVEAVTTTDTPAGTKVTYDDSRRSVLITLDAAARATVEAWWATSLQPPEPRSTHTVVFDRRLEPGHHAIAMPREVPHEASFTATRINGSVYVFTVGPMPSAVTRLVPASATDRRLPDVEKVTTHSDPRPADRRLAGH
jgi:hypothetical protein